VQGTGIVMQRVVDDRGDSGAALAAGVSRALAQSAALGVASERGVEITRSLTQDGGVTAPWGAVSRQAWSLSGGAVEQLAGRVSVYACWEAGCAHEGRRLLACWITSKYLLGTNDALGSSVVRDCLPTGMPGQRASQAPLWLACRARGRSVRRDRAVYTTSLYNGAPHHG
jgi:hypothetical protein